MQTIKARADKELVNIVKRTGRELFDSTTGHGGGTLQPFSLADHSASLPANLRESLVMGVPDTKAPLLQDVLDVLYTQFQCVVDTHENVVIAKLQSVQERERPSNGVVGAQSEMAIYTADDIWTKVHTVLQYVTDLYIELCTAEKNSVSVSALSNSGSGGDESSAVSDLNNYFAKKRVGLSAAVGNSFGKSKKECPLFRFESSSHAMSLNAYLREQKDAMREKSELTSDALDAIDIERILGFVGAAAASRS